jgi:hypothetical protein
VMLRTEVTLRLARKLAPRCAAAESGLPRGGAARRGRGQVAVARHAQAGFRHIGGFNRKPTVASKGRSRNRGFSGQHQANMSIFNGVDRTPLPPRPMLGGLFRKYSRFPVAASAYW